MHFVQTTTTIPGHFIYHTSEEINGLLLAAMWSPQSDFIKPFLLGQSHLDWY